MKLFKSILTSLLVLVSTLTFSQTLVYETGETTGDPWTGWSDNSYGSIITNTSVDAYDRYVFTLVTSDSLWGTLDYSIDLTSYDSVKFEFDFFSGGNPGNWEIFTSNDSLNWTLEYSSNSTTSDTLITSNDINYIRLKISYQGSATFGYYFETFKIYGYSNGGGNVGIDELNEIDANIYSYSNNVVINTFDNLDVKVYTLGGQLVNSQSINTKTEITLNDSGVYVVLVSDGKSIKSEKVYIQ